MGCKQSKPEEVGGFGTPEKSPRSAGSPSSKSNGAYKSPSPVKSPRPATKSTLYYILDDAVENPKTIDVTSIWPQVIQMCAKDKGTVFYVDPETSSTPLHLACRLIDLDTEESHSAIHGIRSLIKIHPDALSCKDNRGHIPLHYAIAPLEQSDDFIGHLWERRAEILRLLIASDYESSTEYLSRNDLIYDEQDEAGACTALYRAIEQIPDDSGNPGPTVSYIGVIQGALCFGECFPRWVYLFPIVYIPVVFLVFFQSDSNSFCFCFSFLHSSMK